MYFYIAIYKKQAEKEKQRLEREKEEQAEEEKQKLEREKEEQTEKDRQNLKREKQEQVKLDKDREGKALEKIDDQITSRDTEKAEKLPNTSTNNYTYLLVGLIMIFFSSILLIRARKVN